MTNATPITEFDPAWASPDNPEREMQIDLEHFTSTPARRNPQMMGGASPIDDFAYNGSGRPGIAWFTPLRNGVLQWTSKALPGQPISFSTIGRCLDGGPPPCGGAVESSVRLRPSPLFAFGSNRDIDILLLDTSALADSIMVNDGASYSPWHLAGLDLGNEIDDQVIPLIGDFNGDAIDDIFWYAARSESPDLLSVIWEFDADGGHVPRTFSINGDYSPIIGDFDDDGCSDVLWYDPTNPDRRSPLWRCVEGGDFACDLPAKTPADAFPIGSGPHG